MKVWRVISLILWGSVLTGLLAVSSAYYLLSSTVLDQSKTTKALHQTAFYDAVRDQMLLPKVQEQFTAGQSGGAVLPEQDVITEVKKVFTADKIQQIADQVLGATYQWADNKAPNIDFTVSVANEKKALESSLETRIKQNVAALPRCGINDEIPDDLATSTCLPIYVSRDAVSTAAIDAMNNHLQGVSDTLNPDTLKLTNKDLGSSVNIPDYIGYLWTLNLITLPLALIVTLYLLLKRHGAGLITVGLSVGMIGIFALCAYVMLHGVTSAGFDNALDREVVKATKLLLEPTLLLASGVGLGAAVIAVTGGIFWLRGRRKS